MLDGRQSKEGLKEILKNCGRECEECEGCLFEQACQFLEDRIMSPSPSSGTGLDLENQNSRSGPSNRHGYLRF